VVRYWQPEGTLDVSDTILECDPPRALSFTWKVEWVDEFRDLPPAIVTFKLEDPTDHDRSASDFD
jgi:hypothetical protein